MAISVRSATIQEAPGWLRMRQALWPEDATSHAGEVERSFAGELRLSRF
jgi:hypothetical protein